MVPAVSEVNRRLDLIEKEIQALRQEIRSEFQALRRDMLLSINQSLAGGALAFAAGLSPHPQQSILPAQMPNFVPVHVAPPIPMVAAAAGIAAARRAFAPAATARGAATARKQRKLPTTAADSAGEQNLMPATANEAAHSPAQLSSKFASITAMYDEWNGTGEFMDKPVPGGFEILESKKKTQ